MSDEVTTNTLGLLIETTIDRAMIQSTSSILNLNNINIAINRMVEKFYIVQYRGV